MPEIEWPFFAPYVKAINELKKVRGAVILAHNYQTPEIYNCVADVVGDSLQLAREATKTTAEVIVQCGVHFMAETSKILNPDKVVLIPDSRAGCSLADAITGEDVRLLRARYPGVPVIAYVNTSAEVKAEVDICCTSANALQVVESLGAERVIMLPDQYLAKYVASQTDVKIIAWKGACEVHERFTGDELKRYRADDPSIHIIAHPECPPDVIAEADYTGSTSGMVDWARRNRPQAPCPGHRMLHGGQRVGGTARHRVRAAMQSVPAHEAHHPAEDPLDQPPDHAGGSGGRFCRSRTGPAARSNA